MSWMLLKTPLDTKAILAHNPRAPKKSPDYVLFTYLNPSSGYDLYSWSPRVACHTGSRVEIVRRS